jgi:tRNA (guanine10-N2)-methyltransferase
MDYLIRFSQSHETFRLPEIEALAVIEGIDMKVVSYSLEVSWPTESYLHLIQGHQNLHHLLFHPELNRTKLSPNPSIPGSNISQSPFCIVSLPSSAAAKQLIQRSILAMSVHELWGSGGDLSTVHSHVRETTSHLWERYMTCSFKFSIDSYQGSRTADEKVSIINSFAYLGFAGPIRMRGADEEFTLFEDWEWNSTPLGIPDPKYYYFGRYLGSGARDLPKKLDLKKRRYISTTSMDAELALVTANLALAAPGKIIYDPFVGTGSFPIACAQFGAVAFGSDIDGRSIRGDEKNRTLKGNFEQYGLLGRLGGMFTADLTNSPIRRVPLRYDGDGVTGRLFDGIVCDPPYGVREGLRVLGVRDPEKCPWVIPKGKEMYK